jgi:hypothetical protein
LAVPTPVGLGTATNASVLSSADPTNTNPSTLSGDASSSPNALGTMPGFGQCGSTNCVSYGVGAGEHLHDGTATQQVADETAAHIATAALLGATPIPAALGGQSLTAGLYSTGAALLSNNQTLTLDAANNPGSVWIFQVASTITTGTGSNIVFINTGGATTDQLACNVFWTAGAAATLNGTTFVGTVMATSGVQVGSAVTVHGRLFGGTSGSVTLIGDTINSGNCTVLPAGTGGGPAGSGGGSGFTGGGTGGGSGATGGGTAVSFPGSPATPMLAAPQTAG